MGDIIRTNLSGVLAFQRALATTSNNIANAQTPGYSRQHTEMSALLVGDNYTAGSGVTIRSVTRSADAFVNEQLNTAQADVAYLDQYSSIANRVTDLVAAPDLGLSQSLSDFFASVEELSNDPSSIPMRQVVLDQAALLTSNFTSMQDQINSIDSEIDSKITDVVSQVNILTGEIHNLNNLIVDAYGRDLNNPPNELLDQRDLAVVQLNELVRVKTLDHADGRIDVIVPNGQPLVIGGVVNAISLVSDEFNASRSDVVLSDNAGFSVEVSKQFTGGALGGLLAARSDVIDRASQELGLLATGVAESFNVQHAQGITLNGSLGGDFFSLTGASVAQSKHNAGSAAIDVQLSAAADLEGQDYIFTYDGSDHYLFNQNTGQQLTLSGSGTAIDPFVAEGVSIEITSALSSGDRFRIAAYSSADSLSLSINDPREIAAQGALVSASDLNNIGNGQISLPEISDSSDANLLTPVTISFNDPPSSYAIDGSGTFSYTSGDEITINGWALEISGEPVSGDSFTISPNLNGSADNRNALALAQLDGLSLFDGYSQSINDKVDNLIGDFASTARRLELNLEAKQTVFNQVTAEREAVSGVNLDEEAADLMRYQQAFQAAAQGISAANSMFNSLLQALR